MVNSLWGDEFIIPTTQETAKKIINKVSKPKVVKTTEQKIKSKTISIEDKLSLITAEVNRILGHYKEDTLVIKSKEQLEEYIDKAINNKIIAIDTETNNSLDPITCKLMGPCIYTPGMKNAYIPINHVNYKTGTRLDWQITEQDIYEQFSRLDGIEIITHNGKFDYEVLYCTTGWKMPVTWDTMIGSRLLNENERAGLKQQYIEKIDPSQEKYSIDKLFENIEYAIVDPDVFALYAATDPFMTYKLYLWQKNEFNKEENIDVFKVFNEIEMPIIFVLANMELRGVEVDQAYSAKLSPFYHKKSDHYQTLIDQELLKLKPAIDAWRLTKDANIHLPKKTGIGEGKSKNEQLSDPPDLNSPTQLAILLYDILKIKSPDFKNPRGTGAEILKTLAETYPLCKLIDDKRGIDKLLNTFIDTLPELVKEKTGRLHASFNSYGADTGRMSSSSPNLQNIPSHAKEIRLIFNAKIENHDVEINNNCYTVPYTDDVQLFDKTWCKVKDLKISDKLFIDENNFDIIKDIKQEENNYIILV